MFDHAFIGEHTMGVDKYLSEIEARSWELIEQQSGLSIDEIKQAARMYRRSERAIVCWSWASRNTTIP